MSAIIDLTTSSLPDPCFCFRGQQLNLPTHAFNAKGIPYIKPIYVIPPVEDPDIFLPKHAVQLLSEKEYVCIPCNKIFAAHGHATKLTNGYDHVRNQHPEELPFNCWTAKQIEDVKKKCQPQ